MYDLDEPMACEAAGATLDLDAPDSDVASAAAPAAMGIPESVFCAPPQRRCLARARRIDFERHIVICHQYRRSSCGGALSMTHGARASHAQLCYWLPQNWSVSYRFTVFEGSFIVRLLSGTSDVDQAETPSPLQYHLARPLQPLPAGCGLGQPLPEFELVWPVPLDHALLDAVQSASQHERGACKRKPQHEPTISSMHHKLRRLSM